MRVPKITIILACFTRFTGGKKKEPGAVRFIPDFPNDSTMALYRSFDKAIEKDCDKRKRVLELGWEGELDEKAASLAIKGFSDDGWVAVPKAYHLAVGGVGYVLGRR